MNLLHAFAPMALCGLVGCVPMATSPDPASEIPPPTASELDYAIQLFVDRSHWDVTQIESTGQVRWNSAYTDHWPSNPAGVPLIQGIHHLEGWEVTFQARPKFDRNPQGTSPKLFQVLIDKDRTIHWRKAWPALPPGLQHLGQ